MPTPCHVFARVAARLGGVDPRNSEAVQRWFMEAFPRLSLDRIEEALEELLRADGMPETEPVEPFYPRDVPLPTLEESPEAKVSGWWHELWTSIRRWVRRRRT